MQKQTLLIVLALLIVAVVGFVAWFQSNRGAAPLRETQPNSFVSSTAPVSTSTTSNIPTGTTSTVTPKVQKKPTSSQPKNPTEACIQAELDAGETDANAIFRKCLSGFSGSQ